MVAAETDMDTATELVEVWKTEVDSTLDPSACTQFCFALLHDDAYANPVPVVGRSNAAELSVAVAVAIGDALPAMSMLKARAFPLM